MLMFIGLFILNLHKCCCASSYTCTWHEFSLVPYAGSLDSADEVWHLNNTVLPQCVWRCLMAPTCYSVKYTPATQSCVAFRKIYSGFVIEPRRKKRESPVLPILAPPPPPDYQVYVSDKEEESECGSAADCVMGDTCVLGMCYCDSPAIGYSRDGRTCRPLTECVLFSNDFTYFDGHFILWNDITSHNFQTPETCREICIDTEGCISFEFDTVLSICYPQSLAWLDANPLERFTSDLVLEHYQRECDWLSTNLLK